MIGPKKKITRCEQAGDIVRVYGSFAVEGPERIRVLFEKPGKLHGFTEDTVRLEAPDGALEVWSAEEEVSREPVSTGDLFEDLRRGNHQAAFQVVLIIVVLLIALMSGGLDQLSDDLSSVDDPMSLTEPARTGEAGAPRMDNGTGKAP